MITEVTERAVAVQLVRFWPDYFFTQAKNKRPCRLRSVLYGRAEKAIEVQ